MPEGTALPRARNWWKLIVLLAIVAAVAAMGASLSAPKVPGWYAALAKPVFMPPSWVFGPVWTVLYGLMALAAWRIWDAPSPAAHRREALAFFAMQLVLNALWPAVFFGMQKPVSGLIVIIFLLSAVVATLLRFQRIDRVAGLLLVPYLAWVGFATLLNAAIVGLNP